jgi:MFS family permease
LAESAAAGSDASFAATPGKARRRPSPLRHRDFRVLIAGTVASQLGNWVQTIALGWLVLHDLNGSATALGLVALVRGTALLTLSPVSGYLAGRFERRRLLMIYSTGSALVAALMATLIGGGWITLPLVYVLSGTGGTLEALSTPIRSLLVYDTVKGEDVANAVAINGVGANAMRVIGPATAGVLIGFIGTDGAFQVQAGALFVAVVFTWALRPSAPEHRDTANFFRSVAGGFRYVARDRTVRPIVALAVVPSALIFPYVSFLPVFARDVLGSDQQGYGLLASSVGLGSVIGGVLIALQDSTEGMGRRILTGVVLYISGIFLFTLMRDLWLAMAALVVVGFFLTTFSATHQALLQTVPVPEFRSRVIALQSMFQGLTPFSALFMGLMIDRWGAPRVVEGYLVLAALAVLAIAVGSRELRRM